ncbi:hypothetical protein C8R43DRAFT_1123452 [Mycena crocata]|nr:hypothetical protein C8R43DRAFT_1123452 [Mycena crocata]
MPLSRVVSDSIPALTDSATTFLADAIPLPELMTEECPKLYKHKFNICLGAQVKTRHKIARYSVFCPGVGRGKCQSRQSRSLSVQWQEVLHTLMADRKEVLKHLKHSPQGTPGYLAVMQEGRDLDDRKAAIYAALSKDGPPGPDCVRSAAGKRKRAQLDDSDGEPDPKNQKPAAKKRKNVAVEQHNGSNAPSVSDKGKGKAVGPQAVEQDEYDPDMYALDPTQRCNIDGIFFTAANTPAHEVTLKLRHAGNLYLGDMDVTRFLGAETFKYDWFCPVQGEFIPGAFTRPINMLRRGTVLVCRSAGVLDSECPGIQDWIDKVYDSVAAAAMEDDSEPEGVQDDYEELSSSWVAKQKSLAPTVPPIPSSSMPSSSAIATSSPVRAGPSSQVGDAFRGIAQDHKFWEREEKEEKKLKRQIERDRNAQNTKAQIVHLGTIVIDSD